MSSIELRHIINEHLSHIEDVPFLNALKTIVESKVSEGFYKLSDYQKKRIDLARGQLKDRQTISHDDLQKEINQWLSSK
jgi:ABC-type multidrug transport system fused ATPase/permease subunit